MKKKMTLFCAVMVAVTMSAAEAVPSFEFQTGNVHVDKPSVNKAVPVELNLRKTTYNSAEFDWWYFGFAEEGGFAYSLWTEGGKFIAGTTLSFSETDYVTYLDGVTFKDEHEDRDVESHYYISTYWILNSLNGIQKGEDAIWQQSVCDVEKGNTAFYALRAGTYYVQIQEYLYDGNGNPTVNKQSAQLKFEIYDNVVKNLKAEVAADKKTATITWEKPSLPAGVHLYMSVQSGSVVAYDNNKSKVSPEMPLTVNVEEGRTYSVSAQYVNGKNEPMGSEVKIYFTVGTNNYIPTDLKATVIKDDNVEFSWKAATAAAYYNINVYEAGTKYASYTTSESKLAKQLPSGTYTWEVAAYEKAEDNLYYPLSEYVKGNEFTTKSAPLPEGTIEMNVWGMNAAYIASESSEGKYAWLVMFETGDKNGTGLPEPWIVVYADRELALSGSYSNVLGNAEISANTGEGSFMNTNGTEAGLIQATSVEMKLEFEGFDMDYQQLGYFIPYYSGSFLMTCTDNKTYHGTLNGLICAPFTYETLTSSEKELINMLGEAGDVQGIDEVEGGAGLDLSQPMYNVLGQPVDNNYKGVVIQGGKKFFRN